ncbi:MAG TPA: chromate resistance protein ChrB domain-containing protein [Myxococcales bacterium]|nr:chromate resistance protein ChrB domain-containing protein [Myxococcales bacterium]
MADDAQGWLLLIHQIPPKPHYLRVKIGRRLQALGAVAIKNSVYALPASDEAREDLNWVRREIVSGGGDGSLVEARFIEGLNDEQVREMFRAARDADYFPVTEELRALSRRFLRHGPQPAERRAELEPRLVKLGSRLAEIARLDFFGARGRETAVGLHGDLTARLDRPQTKPGKPQSAPRGATWVTRTGIHVDRMACAWLIRRFIDPDARLQFVPVKSYRHKKGELRFDMFDGEFTHEGDLCSFEVLLRNFAVTDGALRVLAEIIHDIDLKDEKYGRPEKAGFEAMINGIAMAHPRDEARLARASAVLDDLYELFKRKRRS